jgi:spore maturation protein SpmA
MRQVENMDEAAKAMALKAMEELQEQMRGEAEKAGLRTEEDVIRLVKEIRYEDDSKPEANDENQ